MRSKEFTEKDIRNIHAEYFSGTPLIAIANSLGCSVGCFTRHFKKYNLKRLSRSEVQFSKKKKQLSLTSEAEQEIISYYSSGGAIEETADKFKITCKRLKKMLKENNINIRTKSEQLANKPKEWHQARIAASTKTIMDLYGASNPMQIPGVATKVSSALRKSKRDRSTYVMQDGRLLVEICEEKGILPTTLRNVWQTHNGDLATIAEWVENYNSKSTHTSIEINMLALLQKAGIDAIRFNKNFNGYRPDIATEDLKVFIECDGLYYHSEKFRDKLYHNNKAKMFEELGVKAFQFRENEILLKPDICVSMILVACNMAKKIHARKTNIKTFKNSEVYEFFETNHLMGNHSASRPIALVDKDENILACMTYQIKKSGSLEIIRFASKLNTVVVGGFSKLLKAIELKHPNLDIKSFVDLRYSVGSSLVKNGFIKESESIGFSWVKNSKCVYNRLHCRANMDDRNLSEAEYAKEMKLIKIYDAGQRLYVKRADKNV